MADLRRYLPLSNREPVDESGVSGDWRALTARSLTLLADRLEALPPDAWTSGTLRPSPHGAARDEGAVAAEGRMTVAAVVERLAHRLESGRLQLLVPDVLLRSDRRSPDRLISALRAAAAAPRRRGVGDLGEVLLAACDIGHSRPFGDARESGAGYDSASDGPASDSSTFDLGAFDERAFGAAVLARAAVSSPAIRSIVQQRTLAPTDAAWRIGVGPEIRAPSAVLLLWLAGRDVRPEFA